MGTATSINQQPIVEYVLETAKVVLYQNIVVVVGTEGTHVTYEKVTNVLRIVKEIYGTDIPFVYISNRIHSYSIDPLAYYEAIKLFPNLKAYAIVSHNKRSRTLAVLEKLFMKKSIRVFDELEKAFEWAEQMITKNGIV